MFHPSYLHISPPFSAPSSSAKLSPPPIHVDKHITDDAEDEARCFECDHTAQLAKVSELHKCAGCQEVMFCSEACQQASWPAHKARCKTRNKILKVAALDAADFVGYQAMHGDILKIASKNIDPPLGPEMRSRTLFNLAYAHVQKDAPDFALPVFTLFYTLFNDAKMQHPPSRSPGWACHHIADLHIQADPPRGKEAMEWAVKAREKATFEKDVLLDCQASWLVGRCLWIKDEVPDAVENFRYSRELWKTLGGGEDVMSIKMQRTMFELTAWSNKKLRNLEQVEEDAQNLLGTLSLGGADDEELLYWEMSALCLQGEALELRSGAVKDATLRSEAVELYTKVTETS
mmetsp:Transcript_51293/g.121563  ORF Transcript_51293/g.121563 Transcript_51293/m.121563 type:complete len:346 (-) Transcript_51293:3-1040(-)